jgi:hypothetical protein
MRFLVPALLLGALGACGLPGCEKVPIVDINAGFSLADATWFEEEQTLFIFYTVSAEQGLGPDSRIEVTWRTDNVEQPWIAVADLAPIHTHLPVLCGPNTLCGSTSIKVEKVPRQVGLRLRYHREGELALDAPLVFNIVGKGPAHSQRSLIVYGVFEETNNTVQWRARHQFPTLRNEQAQLLGLRRKFHVTDIQYGNVTAPPGNPYGYAFWPICPAGLTKLPWNAVETSNRAIFDENKLPLSASTSLGVCAQSVVLDAKGAFEAVAIARKNPEVHPSFPLLRSPIKRNTEIGLLLHPCMRQISEVHLTMQIQRLILEGSPDFCTDNFMDASWPNALAAKLRTMIEATRPAGKDMVLALSLHHDDTKGVLGRQVERALEQLLPAERDKTSPRVSGAVVFDSFAYSIVSPAVRSLVLWCPANIDIADLEKIPDAAERACPLQPDFPDLKLGPFRFGVIPILPTRAQYLTFIEKYSVAQAGKVIELKFLAPERTPISKNVPVGDFAIASFFDNETFNAAPADSFSFCQSGDPDPRVPAVVFRTPQFAMPLPLSFLPEFHQAVPTATYEIGLLWDFPFLTRMQYEFVAAGAATAFSLSIPFGISSQDKRYYGSQVWGEGPAPDGGMDEDAGTPAGQIPLANTLEQCTRFCDHPTFDSSGVYNVADPFHPAYQKRCYAPAFPTPPGQDFPLDP